MKKVLLPIVLASAFIGLGTANAEIKPIYMATPRDFGDPAAICVGTHESINSSDEATDVCKVLKSMGYQEMLYTRPTYSDLTMLSSVLLFGHNANNIYFFSGHADSNRMHWGEYRSGNERVGISIIKNDNYENYNFVDSNFISAALAVYMGCGTALNPNNNLPKYGYEKGQAFTIGWYSEEIYDGDTDNWASHFFASILSGNTIRKSIRIANEQNYKNNYNTKAVQPYGEDRAFASVSRNVTVANDIKEVILKDSTKLDEYSAAEYIKNNFDKDFNPDDYYLEINENDEETIYTYSLKVDDIKYNIGYTIIRDNIENNIILADNMHNTKVNEMKNIKKVSNYSKTKINEEELTMNALSKYTNNPEINTTISYNSSQKYYDVKKGILYFDVYLNSFDPITNTKSVITESFEI